MTDRLPPALNRRRALTGAATVGIGVPLLAACSSDEGSTASDAGSAGGSAGGSLGATADIEVGGGTVFSDQQVVVTQPSKGEFKCFTAVCTHQGCIVSSVSGGDIHCKCHNSAFSIDDGSVVTGPATKPLAEQRITVEGGTITLA